MKVLSLTQPWASLICLGSKKVETRSWRSWYTGPLLIHASKGYPKWAQETAREEPFYSELCRPHGEWSRPEDVCGCIIGRCELIQCVPTEKYLPNELEREFGDYAEGRFAWLLKDGQFLPKPIPARGSLGIWEFDLEGAEQP